MKVRIKKVPQARTGYQVQGSLANDVPAMGGADYNAYIGMPKPRVSKYITAVPREEANLEAEGGETVYGDLNGDGMAEHKIIKGPRHSDGGVPLNLPDDTFIYSDFRGMNIKDPALLNMFGKTGNKKGKKSYTPAELAKQYDIEKYRKILQDPNSDKIDRKTAELMIKNYQTKLAALALVQEAEKGFPQGIAKASQPFLDENQYSEDTFLSPEIKQFSQQIDSKIAESETDNSNTELQDEELAEAEEINQGQPVAQPQGMEQQQMQEPMEQPMAQYGMSMGGFEFPYAEELPEAQYGGMSMEEYDLPEAEYGMAMGANPRNYMGRPKSPMYARGGALNKYQTKGAVDEIDITGMTPEQARYARWNHQRKLKNEGKTFTEPKYYKTVNGKRVDVDYQAPAENKGASTPDEIKAVNAAQEKLLEEQLNDPIVKQKLYEQTVMAMKDRDSYRTSTGGFATNSYDHYSKLAKDPNKFTPDTVAKAALAQTKRSNRVKEAGINPAVFDNNGNLPKSPNDLVTRGVAKNIDEAKKIIADYKTKNWLTVDKATTAIGLTNPTQIETGIEQATSRGYAGIIKTLKEGKVTDEKELFALTNFAGDPADDKSGKGRFNLNTGATDESNVLGEEYAEISPIDGDRKNTTSGQGIGAGINHGEFVDKVEEEKKTDECPCGKDDTGKCKECEEEEEALVDVPKEPAEFWLQDNLKTAGAFANLMSIKKQMPWAPKADLVAPKPTFLDPTRELAANAEQANIQTQALAQFAGPQALSARSSGVTGAASKNAADVMSKYNNANVNLANQFETNIANIENQERQLNMAAQSKLYDQNTIANQQYDNAKTQARNQLLNQTANAYTNRAKTDAMNQLYPQYRVDQGSGGLMTFTKGKDMKKGTPSKDYDDYMDECRQSGLTNDDAIVKCALNKLKASGSSSNNEYNPEAVLAQYQGQNVPLQKHGGFIYSDIAFPFIL